MRVVTEYDPASQSVDVWFLDQAPDGTRYLILNPDNRLWEWGVVAHGESPPKSLSLPQDAARGMLDSLRESLPERPEPIEREGLQREAGRVDRMLDAILDGRLQWAEE